MSGDELVYQVGVVVLGYAGLLVFLLVLIPAGAWVIGASGHVCYRLRLWWRGSAPLPRLTPAELARLEAAAPRFPPPLDEVRRSFGATAEDDAPDHVTRDL